MNIASRTLIKFVSKTYEYCICRVCHFSEICTAKPNPIGNAEAWIANGYLWTVNHRFEWCVCLRHEWHLYRRPDWCLYRRREWLRTTLKEIIVVMNGLYKANGKQANCKRVAFGIRNGSEQLACQPERIIQLAILRGDWRMSDCTRMFNRWLGWHLYGGHKCYLCHLWSP